jgi:anaerobic magnesium-protoporphyrin IX monomethyl ester cyclase
MIKVLFIYPNKEGYPIIPLGISVLSGILKNAGHTVDLFDITFMMPDRLDHDARERTGLVKRVDVGKYWGSGDKIDIESALREKISSFNPDLIAFSIVENNYLYAKKLLSIAKEETASLTIVGGLFPTTEPEYFINDSNVDLICVGEGEYAMEELANRMSRGEDITNIRNLIVKVHGGIARNDLHPFYSWDPLVYQDWDIFDNRHLMKAFTGRMFKTGFFEISRGCPYNCSYCLNQKCQQIFRSLGKYNREKTIDKAMQEMSYLKGKHGLELIFFNDENFLTMKKDRLMEFCSKYKENIDLPFFIMTRADSLMDEEKISILKDTGCATIGIGVESGNEAIRKKLLNKNISNDVYKKAFENCHKHDIRTTANVMIGLPFETEDNIRESASFCRELDARSVSLAIFAPYHGTKLRKICIDNGYVNDGLHENIAIINDSILTMPQLSKDKIRELYYKFNDMVYK